MIDEKIKNYITAMKNIYTQNKYIYEKKQNTLKNTIYYNNKIFENGKLAFYFDILPFEI